MKDIVITHGIRTPIAKMGGSLQHFREDELGAMVIQHLVTKQAQINPAEVNHVIMGQVKQSSNPSNLARVAALRAGLPEQVTADTVHRQCGSGLQAIIDGYQMIACEEADTIVAGGAENMSRSVYFMRNTRQGLGSGNYTIEDSLTEGGPGSIPIAKYGNQPMGVTAENLADQYQISREEQDLFAHHSQEKAAYAIKQGHFSEQIMPVEIPKGFPLEIPVGFPLAIPVGFPRGIPAGFPLESNNRLFQTDEHPFLSSVEKLSTLPAVFKKGGTVTAGNSSGRNDGAAAVLLMSGEKAKSLGFKPMVRIRAVAASGCDPLIMGISPVECTRLALVRANLTLRDLDVIELNEAFAAQALAVIKEWQRWGIGEAELLEKVNPNGGAIALGHPLGCTGTALTVKCMYELLRVPTHRYGLITLCCAGGVGVAVIIEKIGGANR